jgi:hypothetical protein
MARLLFPAHHDMWVNDASAGAANHTASNNNSIQSNHVSPDHLNSSSQLALWIAIFLYFMVVMCISCAGRKNHTSDVEFCLVKKVSYYMDMKSSNHYSTLTNIRRK